MTIEIRVPLSPTPAFLNRTLLLAASIREFYPDAIVKAYIGNSVGSNFLDTDGPFERAYNAFRGHNIAVEWIVGAEFDLWEGTRSPFLATMNRRWSLPVEGDHVLIMDADTLVTGRLDDPTGVFAATGVMTHVPPMPAEEMRFLWQKFTGRTWPEYVHSGAGIMCGLGQTSPWYVNSGFCMIPRPIFEFMVGPYHDAIAFLRKTLPDTYWFDQLALGLAAAKADVPRHTLSLCYNFPNQAAFDEAHPKELADCRILHYLRTDTVDRDVDFADLASMHRFIARPGLTGSNQLLQRRVGQLLGKVWPHPEYTAEDAPYA